MGGYVCAFGHCVLCGTVLMFNPIRVPSLRVDGTRHPVCSGCVTTRINPARRKQGLEDLVVAEDAYESVAEEEIIYYDHD